jgi:hypothetical protein
MDFVVAICSHNRHEAIKAKTLRMLDDFLYPHHNIYIFVALAEFEVYKKSLEKDDYGRVHLIIGELGLAEQRRCVTEFFDQGQKILLLDDDIQKFMRIDTNETFEHMVMRGFTACEKYKAHLWGFYPCANKGWLKESVTVGLVFIYGCAYGLINCKDTNVTMSIKEDTERSILFFKRDSCVVRLNDCAPVQKYLKNPGGLSDVRTYAKEEEACILLQESYPHLCRIVRKENRVEVKLTRILYPSKL